MSDTDVCKRCEKPGHSARHCKTPFKKCWPGKPAVKLTLRRKDGAMLSFTGSVSEQVYSKFGEALLEALSNASQKDSA